MHAWNRWTALRQVKVDESVENEERSPKKEMEKVVYAPELPKNPYGIHEPPHVPNLSRDY